MQRLLRRIAAAARGAGTPQEIHAVCASIADAYGFEHFLHTTRFPSSFVKPFTLVIGGCPAGWQQCYAARNYLSIDPLVAHGARSVRPLVWDELSPLAMAGFGVRRLAIEARRHGLCSGFSVPMHGAHGELSLLSLASPLSARSARPRIERALAPVHLLAAHLHEAACRLADGAQLPFQRSALTERERECLLWTAEGKTSWETAQIIGISERTVIFHLRHVSEKLGCANRQQAVALAIAQGLIAPHL